MAFPARSPLCSLLFLVAAASQESCGDSARNWELVDANRTALAVIDVQQNFLDKLPLSQRSSLVQRIKFLMKAAIAMKMPIIATAEDYADGGTNPPMHPTLSALLPTGAHVWNKLVWNMYGQADIRAAVDELARTNGVDAFILVGLETDVCVAQSALGLQAGGFRVVVVEDAVGTPPPHHAAGIRRLRDAGVTVTDAKGVYYELVRDVPTVMRVSRAMGGEQVVGDEVGSLVEGCASDYTL